MLTYLGSRVEEAWKFIIAGTEPHREHAKSWGAASLSHNQHIAIFGCSDTLDHPNGLWPASDVPPETMRLMSAGRGGGSTGQRREGAAAAYERPLRRAVVRPVSRAVAEHHGADA